MDPKDVTTLPTPLAELAVALLWVSIYAYHPIGTLNVKPELRPLYRDAACMAVEAALSVADLATSSVARDNLDAAVTAARLVFPDPLIDDLITANAAARAWLWKNPSPITAA